VFLSISGDILAAGYFSFVLFVDRYFPFVFNFILKFNRNLHSL